MLDTRTGQWIISTNIITCWLKKMNWTDFKTDPNKAKLLEEIPNWAERWKDGLDYIVPSTQQEIINSDVRFTAGNAFFPTDVDCPALLGIKDDEIERAVIFEKEGTWSIGPKTDSGMLINHMFETGKETQFSDRSYFPLRLVSRLENPFVRGALKLQIGVHGFPEEWSYK